VKLGTQRLELGVDAGGTLIACDHQASRHLRIAIKQTAEAIS
jgi:hypothetical protein